MRDVLSIDTYPSGAVRELRVCGERQELDERLRIFFFFMLAQVPPHALIKYIMSFVPGTHTISGVIVEPNRVRFVCDA